jgi:hypothetical protein
MTESSADLQKEESERPFRVTRASPWCDLSSHPFLCVLVAFVPSHPNQQKLIFSRDEDRGGCSQTKRAHMGARSAGGQG